MADNDNKELWEKGESCLCWTMPNPYEAVAVVGAQMPRQPLEKCVVRCPVAIPAR